MNNLEKLTQNEIFNRLKTYDDDLIMLCDFDEFVLEYFDRLIDTEDDLQETFLQVTDEEQQEDIINMLRIIYTNIELTSQECFICYSYRQLVDFYHFMSRLHIMYTSKQDMYDRTTNEITVDEVLEDIETTKELLQHIFN